MNDDLMIAMDYFWIYSHLSKQGVLVLVGVGGIG